MQDITKKLASDYDSEEESQMNESIDDISVEEGGDINANIPEEQRKSKASLQHLRSNPELLDTEGNDVKSLLSGKGKSP